jgi:hypothetical protein
VQVDWALVAVLTLLGSGVIDGGAGVVRVWLGTGLDAAGGVGQHNVGGAALLLGGVGDGVGAADVVAGGWVVRGAPLVDEVQPASRASAARAATSRCAGRWSTAGSTP